MKKLKTKVVSGLYKWLKSPLMEVQASELPYQLYGDSRFMPDYIYECDRFFESVNVVPFQNIKSIPNDYDESFKWNRYEEIAKDCQETLNFILKNFQFFFRNPDLKEIYLKKYANNIPHSAGSLVINGKGYRVMPDEERIVLQKGTFYTPEQKLWMVADIYDQFVSVLYEYYEMSLQDRCEVPDIPEDFGYLLSILGCETIADLNIYHSDIIGEVHVRNCVISNLSLQKNKNSGEIAVLLMGTSSFSEKCAYSLYINALTEVMRAKVSKYWGEVGTTGFKNTKFNTSIIGTREDKYNHYINEDIVAFCEAVYVHLCDLQIRTGLIPNKAAPLSAAPPPPGVTPNEDEPPSEDTLPFVLPEYFKIYNSKKYKPPLKPISRVF